MIKGDIVIYIDNERLDVYRSDVELENWAELDRVRMECMLEVMNNSPYTFTDSDNYGGTLRESNGKTWQFEFEERE